MISEGVSLKLVMGLFKGEGFEPQSQLSSSSPAVGGVLLGKAVTFRTAPMKLFSSCSWTLSNTAEVDQLIENESRMDRLYNTGERPHTPPTQEEDL